MGSLFQTDSRRASGEFEGVRSSNTLQFPIQKHFENMSPISEISSPGSSYHVIISRLRPQGKNINKHCFCMSVCPKGTKNRWIDRARDFHISS